MVATMDQTRRRVGKGRLPLIQWLQEIILQTDSYHQGHRYRPSPLVYLPALGLFLATALMKLKACPLAVLMILYLQDNSRRTRAFQGHILQPPRS
jgi:hypothetical protein